MTELVQASVDFMDGLYQTLIEPPFWKVFKTQGYRKLESAHSTIYRSVVALNKCFQHLLLENICLIHTALVVPALEGALP